jgi:hypothetical protein
MILLFADFLSCFIKFPLLSLFKETQFEECLRDLYNGETLYTSKNICYLLFNDYTVILGICYWYFRYSFHLYNKVNDNDKLIFNYII